ncbi:MAG: S1 RNA-binding domain-containing protein [Oscillospiraceae bacterium]|nr:S1 RNA-binding domain-containing protein [Oscillospiraceae bacterium]
MDLVVGAVLEGKVTGITKFGAFVALEGTGKSGLVHISEVANTYVNDVKDFVAEGQTVKVKILSIDDSGRINLSIKRAAEPTQPQGQRNPQPRQFNSQPRQQFEPKPRQEAPASASFEDKLKQFMADSDSRISSLYSDHRTSRRKR